MGSRIDEQEVTLNQTWVDLKQTTDQMTQYKASSQKFEKHVHVLTVELDGLRKQLEEGGAAREDAAVLLQKQIEDLRNELERLRVEYEQVKADCETVNGQLKQAESALNGAQQT